MKKWVGLLLTAMLICGSLPALAQGGSTELPGLDAIELTEAEMQTIVCEDSPGSADMNISNIPHFYSCGGDYGYKYFGTMPQGSEMQYCYDTLNNACISFAASSSNATRAVITLNGKDTYFYILNLQHDIFQLTNEQLLSVYYVFRMDHPEYYWLSGSVLYGSTAKGARLIPIIDDEYAAYSNRSSFDDIIDKNFTNCVDRASEQLSISSYAAIKQAHDDVCSAAAYGYDSTGVSLDTPEAHNIQGVFDGDGDADSVCEGYSRALQLILNAIGIDNIYVIGDANGGSHAWNMARFDDGNYYYIDPTWDDSSTGEIQYTYFAKGTVSFAGPAANKHNAYTPAGSGSYFLYELPAVPDTDYSTAHDPIKPMFLSITDDNEQIIISPSHAIPENCMMFAAQYDSAGELIDLSSGNQTMIVQKHESAALVKAFVFDKAQQAICPHSEL